MRTSLPILLSALFVTGLLSVSLPAGGGEPSMDKLLPAPACADGWVLDGTVTLYDKDSLFDRINGESELYFPYGFTTLAYGRYESRKDPKVAVDADVYAMGSLLDAFGVFANYRRKDSAGAAVGVEGVLSSSQLLFYQDRYFVRLQVTGATAIDGAVLLACGRSISRKLPAATARPKELDAFALPAVVPRTERYIASSLLGYEYFVRGIIADAKLGRDEAQVFLVTERSPEAARSAFDRYHDALKAGGSVLRVSADPGGASLDGADPLYGSVAVRQSGRFIAGAVRVTDRVAAEQIVGQVLARAAGQEQREHRKGKP